MNTTIDKSWIQAYEYFLTAGLSSRLKPSRYLGRDPGEASIMIVSVPAITENLEALLAIEPTFERLLFDYMANETLWGAVATKPRVWVSIGLSLKCQAVH